ncbi:MAG: DUF2703 domain-containing protein [Lachnospiraceae bacterium]|nr:DUF2703 domain-containing protein [Lachnospiraceae bacterium]
MMSECCNGIEKKEKVVNVEYLYLDLNTCERCVGTDKVLEDVLKSLERYFKIAGYTVKYSKVEIETEEMAKSYRFLSSPTIRVNGRDIFETIQENNCDCCGDIAGTQVDCRVYSYRGRLYEVPPKELLEENIMKSAFKPQLYSCCIEEYNLPDNLKRFFEGKKQKCCSSSCSCECC